ncbi:MAG: acyl-[acyl-carrier-protein] thioesterase [Solirubrobacteraceae bacterium]
MPASIGEFPARHEGIRAFRQSRRPGFSDCAPSGRMRLDAIACWLQDVAYADVADADLQDVAVWVVRRTRIRVDRFPRFGERFELTTFCSGVGRMWAERRTDVRLIEQSPPEPSGAMPSHGPSGDALPCVQAVSLWVHLDGERWRPSPLTEAELATYGPAPPLRRVSARLRHPAPERLDDGDSWRFRATECDIADHVNNAAYWQPLEEELLRGPDPTEIDVEIEYRNPAQPGSKRLLGDGEWRWIVGEDGELHASILIAAAPAVGADADLSAARDGG